MTTLGSGTRTRRTQSVGNRDSERELCFYTNVMSFIPGQGFLFEETKARSRLEDLKQAGIRWVGVNFPNLEEPCKPDVESCTNVFKGWLDELGFRVTSCHYYGPTYCTPGGSQNQATEHMLRTAEMMAIFAPASLVVHAAWHALDAPRLGCDHHVTLYNEDCAEHGEDQVYAVVAQNLRTLGDALARSGIRLALENTGDIMPLGDCKSLPRLVSMIANDNVGYCVDSGHAHLHGACSAQDWIRLAGDRLFETHFHDNRGAAFRKDEHMPVGFGTISWLDVIHALDDVAFPGPITFETGGWPLADDVDGLRQAIAWWRACEAMASQRERV